VGYLNTQTKPNCSLIQNAPRIQVFVQKIEQHLHE